MEKVVLKPEILGYFNFLPITNTLLVSWIVIMVLTIISFIVASKVKKVPDKLQNIFELVIDFGYSLVSDLAGPQKAKVFFPIVVTFFFFILFANLLGLLPGFATITFKHEPLFRSMNSDLNMTLALALTSAFLTHAFALRYLGVADYLKKWFTLNPIFLFVGLLELIGEFTKIVSLSFRLFGNIFAGEVVLSTVAAIFAFIIPLPFYLLEIIVGFVQAAVFMMLTLVFMVLLSEKHEVDHN
ncbi:F0F1 ATP synthase subunit A [Candidatus Daviesbacteria bacterium]|nr:F0F1 ATP synthase subunit A [Candidatus Daviesbacteria bacterium]